ncbi:MAG TPA: Na(+)/H(+) antiporter subunit C [Egibacteraceae bacterium]|nr:Na(+)/H(+) antiporter subunit C [Egibacteraceae bacterium]
MNLLMAIAVGGLYTVGVWLLLQRSLTRVVMGLVVLGHGVNLLLMLSGGRAGRAPIIHEGVEVAAYTDPLPQALALTAIVISFGITAYLLALAWRSWAERGDDKVEDDVEDRRIAALAARSGRRTGRDEDPDRHPLPRTDPMKDLS